MAYTWDEFIKQVIRHRGKFSNPRKPEQKFPWMAELIVAQSIIESGRGITPLAKEHCNFNGMKYRASVAKFGGKQFKYYTDSEPYRDDGGREVPAGTPGARRWDWFFEFPNYGIAVETWNAFWFRADGVREDGTGGWSPYPRVRDGEGEVLKDLRSFLEYVGPIYCPYFTRTHSKGYADYIIEDCLPEARRKIEEIEKTMEGEVIVTDPTDSSITWLEMNRTDDGRPAVSAYAGSVPKYTRYIVSKKDLENFFDSFPNANSVLVANTVEKIIPNCPDFTGESLPPIPPNPVPTKGSVALDSGHSLKSPGARSNSGKVREEILNERAVAVLKSFLDAAGIRTKWTNPDPDNLTEVGKSGWGDWDIFISWHHNSYSGSGNPYICVMVDADASRATKQFAQKCAYAIHESLKGTPQETQVFSGTNGMPGEYEAELTVTNTSAKDPDGKPPKHVLIETYFLNKFSDEAQCIKATEKAALAVGQVILKELAG